MITKYIWIKNRRFYLYELYNTYKQARQTANYYKTKNKKNKYFIIKTEKGHFFPKIKYALYMNKIIKIW